jgi:hypothetical protein
MREMELTCRSSHMASFSSSEWEFIEAEYAFPDRPRLEVCTMHHRCVNAPASGPIYPLAGDRGVPWWLFLPWTGCRSPILSSRVSHLADRTTKGSCLRRCNEMPSLRRFSASGSGLRIDEVGSLINLLVWFRESLIAPVAPSGDRECVGG